jgi:hypothetical protein
MKLITLLLLLSSYSYGQKEIKLRHYPASMSKKQLSHFHLLTDNPLPKWNFALRKEQRLWSTDSSVTFCEFTDTTGEQIRFTKDNTGKFRLDSTKFDSAKIINILFDVYLLTMSHEARSDSIRNSREQIRFHRLDSMARDCLTKLDNLSLADKTDRTRPARKRWEAAIRRYNDFFYYGTFKPIKK